MSPSPSCRRWSKARGWPASGSAERDARGGHPLADAVGDRRRPPVRPDSRGAGAHVREQSRRAGHVAAHGAVLVDRQGGADDAVDLADEDAAGRPALLAVPAEAHELGDVGGADVADDVAGGGMHRDLLYAVATRRRRAATAVLAARMRPP